MCVFFLLNSTQKKYFHNKNYENKKKKKHQQPRIESQAFMHFKDIYYNNILLVINYNKVRKDICVEHFL